MVLVVLPKVPSEDNEVHGEAATKEELEKEEEEMKKIPSGTRCKGVVRIFNGTRGFGFIKLKKEDKIGVFVHANSLVTDDPFPFLMRGTRVEFEMVFRNGRPNAEKVTLEGGKKIPMQTIANLEVILNEEETFTGTIVRFRGGYGQIAPDKEITWNGVCCKKKIFFYRYGIAMKQGKDLRPRMRNGLRVSFKVYYDERKNLSAFEIRNEDGTPIDGMPKKEFDFTEQLKSKSEKVKRMRVMRAQTARNSKPKLSVGDYSISDLKNMLEEEEKKLKERVLIEDGRTYTGIIKLYSRKKKVGTIHLNERIQQIGYTLLYTIKFEKKDSVFLSPDTIPQRGAEVMFCIYGTKKRPKACKIKNIDGTPIGIVAVSSTSEDEGKFENKDENKKRKRDEEEEPLRERKKIKREVVNEGKTYSGILVRWAWEQKFWEIKLGEKIEYKERSAQNVILAHKWDLDVKEQLRCYARVTFKVYLCEEGLAAFEVKIQSNPKTEEKPSADELCDESSPTKTSENLKNETEIQIRDDIK